MDGCCGTMVLAKAVLRQNMRGIFGDRDKEVAMCGLRRAQQYYEWANKAGIYSRRMYFFLDSKKQTLYLFSSFVGHIAMLGQAPKEPTPEELTKSWEDIALGCIGSVLMPANNYEDGFCKDHSEFVEVRETPVSKTFASGFQLAVVVTRNYEYHETICCVQGDYLSMDEFARSESAYCITLKHVQSEGTAAEIVMDMHTDSVAARINSATFVSADGTMKGPGKKGVNAEFWEDPQK
jgi:hypothetical protein